MRGRNVRILAGPWCGCCLFVAGAFIEQRSQAQANVQNLVSFGNASQSGWEPQAPLIRGADGALYGTTLYGGVNGIGTVFKINTNGTGFLVLHSFSASSSDGFNPYAGLSQGIDGALYGTTEYGGTNHSGTVFKLSTNGSGFAVLYNFGSTGDGIFPFATPIQGMDGMLYGTTEQGGTYNLGTVFKLSTNGSGYTVLYNFTGAGSDGANPIGELMQGLDGELYGATSGGGNSNLGTLFKLSTNGGAPTVLYGFTNAGRDGAIPAAGLVQGRDGMLYGTTSDGGTNNYGTIFKLGTNGGGYTVLYNFTPTNGDSIVAGVMQGSDGALYGTTEAGGADSGGTVYKLNTDGTGFAVLWNFYATNTDGEYPAAGLLQTPDGTLYGTTTQGGNLKRGTLFKLMTNGAGYAVILTMNATGGDGEDPVAQLLQGRDGALYGTAAEGGTNGDGTAFKVSTNGTAYAQLYSFGVTGSGGTEPFGGFIQGADGALFGTTLLGGSAASGTVFTLGTNGLGYAVLYNFGSTNGARPLDTLLQGLDGALYGTTRLGGSYNVGTVFRLGTNGSGYTVLHSFGNSSSDAQNPYGGVILGTDGALYGTTLNGGSNGLGTVFKINTNGSGYTVLYSFGTSSSDGGNPYSGLSQGIDGALYGTTVSGGSENVGTVFRLNTDGTGYTALYSFTTGSGDGNQPKGGLLQGSDGALYGTTYGGGAYGYGTIFRLTTNGAVETVLYSFGSSATDGKSPGAGLIQGADGAFYGTTALGGVMNYGTVFRATVPPIIFGQPTNVAVYLNATATFSVQAQNFFDTSYQWLSNSTPLLGATGASLSLLVLSSNQAAGYSVILSNMYGAVTSSVATLSVLAPTQSVQTVMLHNFGATAGDGEWPLAGLLQASNGTLYGTTYAGGAYGNGTVFGIGTNGAGYGAIVQFSGVNGDAARPEAGLIQGVDGALYGTASAGGAYNYGAVYRTTNLVGTATPAYLHSFGGSERGDGADVYAGIVQGRDDFLYGASASGGLEGCGTLFRLGTNGATYGLTASFTGFSGNGASPYATPIQGSDGALYGTTEAGGTLGYGTVWRMNPPAGGAGPQTLHTFTDSAGDGAYPYGAVVQAADGYLYGVTFDGGVSGFGTIFRVNIDGSGYAVSTTFSGTNGSGANPYGGLVQGYDGALYGTTYSGGAYGYGTVFRLNNPDNSPALQYLHSFSNSGGDGAYAYAGLAQGNDGNLYGTTSSGGSQGEGTVFQVLLDPRIVVPPTNQFVLPGATASFSVTAAGTAPFIYQWLFNSIPLPGQTNSSLVLNNVSAGQAGAYSVALFGALGTVTSRPGVLGVVGPPLFTAVTPLGNGSVMFTLTGVSNATYGIEVSTNLITWTLQTNLLAPRGVAQFTDSNATSIPHRFYRAVWPP